MNEHGFIPENKNYKLLLSYQKSVIIYDCTVYFCDRFFKKFDRTIDQMVQAARSGKQNIVEGSMAAKTSAETEIKLTSVGRSSLEELLEDYHDFLRVKNLTLWEKESEKASYVRKLSSGKIKPPEIDENGNNIPALPPSDVSDSFSRIHQAFVYFIKNRPSDVCANIMICLINQCNYLLDKQIRNLEDEFVKQGGLRERMYNARVKYRKQTGQQNY